MASARTGTSLRPSSESSPGTGGGSSQEGARLLEAASLGVLAPKGAHSVDAPQNMERFGHRVGFILYSTTMPPKTGSSTEPRVLEIVDYPSDRAQVFVKGVEACTAIFRPNAAPTNLAEPTGGWAAGGGEELQLLVENMGRMTFGHGLWDPKGITGSVTVDGHNITGAGTWSVQNMEMEGSQVQKLAYVPVSALAANISLGPVFFKGSLTVHAVGDTYIVAAGPTWRRGWIWVNGFSLGRYWSDMGPQVTMFVPSTLLKEGQNEIIILELHPRAAFKSPLLSFADAQNFTGAPLKCEPDAPLRAGAPLSLYGCGEGGTHQAWTFAEGQLRLAGSSLCMVPAALSGNQTAVLAACGTDPKQELQYDSKSERLTWKNGEALQATGGADGATAVFAAPPTGAAAANAMWSLQNTPAHTLQLVVGSSNKCLSICHPTVSGQYV